MAALKKYRYDEVSAIIHHNNRTRSSYTNKNIDSKKSRLNYSFEMPHHGLSDYEYFQKLVNETYIYGRGTEREKDTVMAVEIVITAPHEISGNPELEKQFFSAVFSFFSDRYDAKNVLSNSVHLDETTPHLHILFCPIRKINHDEIHYKTIKTKSAEKTESGRYEFKKKYKLDEHGEKIPVRNYTRMSDYYDEQISCDAVINKAELQHLHSDLQKYLSDHHVSGKVITGATGGINIPMQTLREITQKTGLSIEQIKELILNQTITQSHDLTWENSWETSSEKTIEWEE